MAHGLIRSQRVIDLASTPDAAPTFDSAQHTMVFNEAWPYASYQAAVNSGNWRWPNDSATCNFLGPDGNVRDPFRIVAGPPAGGNALRVVYFGDFHIGDPGFSGNEGPGFITGASVLPSILAQPGHPMYAEFDFRCTMQDINGTPNGQPFGFKTKFFEIWGPNFGRAQFSVNPPNQARQVNPSGYNLSDTLMGYMMHGGETYNLGLQWAGPFISDYPGQWIHLSYEYRVSDSGPYPTYTDGDNPTNFDTTPTGESGDRSAVAKSWLTTPGGVSTLVTAVELSKVGVAVPGVNSNIYDLNLGQGVVPKWCKTSTLDRAFVNDPITHFVMAGISTSALSMQCTQDFANFKLYYKT